MAAMEVYLHGGKCCGIKHIFGLGDYPSDDEDRKLKTTQLPTEANSYMNSTATFYWPDAPEETKGERFDRYVEFIKKTRPSGVIEVVLSLSQLGGWQEFVEDRGFVRVTTASNSNSHGNIHIYHLSYVKPPVVSTAKPLSQIIDEAVAASDVPY